LFALLAAVLVLLGMPGNPASAQVKTGEYTVSDSSSDKLKPSVNGNIVVWEDSRDNMSNIYGKNLSTGEEFLVSSGVEIKGKPVTNGKYVVWEEKNQNGDSDIYARDLAGGEKFLVAGGPEDQRKPSINGNQVVWESKSGSGGWDIYRYDLTSSEPAPEQPVITGGGIEPNPVIGDGFIVWQDNRNGTSNIYVKNLSTGEEFPVSLGDRFQDQPAISGGLVVWREQSVGNYDVFGRDLYAKDLETGKVFQVTVDPAGVSADQVAPAISGTVVVWEDNRNGKAEVWAKDLATGKEYQVAPGTASPQTSPTVSGETIVWESQYQGDTNYGRYDIHGAEVDSAPAAPLGLKATGSLSGVSLNWSDSTEGDFVGYNVYRGDSADGTFTRLNQSLLSTPSFSDSEAPKGVVSYYQVMAVDAAGNESLPARTSAAAIATSSISLSASPDVVKHGTATELSGKLTADGNALSGKQVVIEQKPASAGGFSLVSRQTTAPDGTFKFGGAAPDEKTYYRASFAGERGIQGSSVDKLVQVKFASALTLSASPEILEYGGATVLSGKLSANGGALSGKQVVIEQKPAGASSFNVVSRRTTGSDGTFRSGALRPKKNTYYRVSFAGEGDIQGSTAARTVRVKAKVSLSPPKVPRLNTNVNITGRVNTTRNGKVNVVVRRNGKIISRTTVRLSDYRYRKTYRLDRAGRYNVQVIVPKTRAHLGDTIARSFSKR
jgi:beta propeller repeat protein